MNVLVWLAAIFLLSDLAVLGYIEVCRVLNSAQTSSVADVAPLIVGAGVLVALITLALNIRRQQSEDYLKNASGLLEKAHTVLSQVDEKNRPKNIRINWLAAARFIRASDSISKRITEPSHKAIFREHREYWRARFHDLINPSVEGFPEDYFATSPKTFTTWHDDDRDPLSETSLAVLYRFVRWPRDFEDPIKNEPEFTSEEIEKMEMFGPKSLGSLMKKVRELEAKRKTNA